MSKPKKKMTKKELKALNHAKVMGQRQPTIPGQGTPNTSLPSNVIPIHQNLDKNKAA
jgi:hypothetical protein